MLREGSITKRILSIGVEAIISVSSFYALSLIFMVSEPAYSMFGYLSVILTIVTAIGFSFMVLWSLFRTTQPGWLLAFRYQIVVYWNLIFLIYTFMLLPFLLDSNEPQTVNNLANTIIHIGLPMLVILDYLWFTAKGNLSKRYILLTWLPLAFYTGVIYYYRNQGGTFNLLGNQYDYPYFFMNPERIGFLNVILSFVGIFSLTALLGWVVYKLDEILATRLNLTKTKRK
jgi:hypothetical protein